MDDDLAVQRDAAFLDHPFDIAARTNTGACEQPQCAAARPPRSASAGFGLERGGGDRAQRGDRGGRHGLRRSEASSGVDGGSSSERMRLSCRFQEKIVLRC